MGSSQFGAATQQDDTTFWSERFRDHAMLLFVLLDPQNAGDLKQEAYQQLQNWNAYLKTPNSNLLPQLVNSLGNLKQNVLNRAQMSPINLALSPNDFIALVSHMIEELSYFIHLTSGQLTSEAELNFWVEENIEHTDLAGHLIPLLGLNQEQTQQLQLQGMDLIQRLKNARDPHTVLPLYQMSNQMALKLDELIPKLPSLDPTSNEMVQKLSVGIQQQNIKALEDLFRVMLEHEIKEGIRGAQRIQNL